MAASSGIMPLAGAIGAAFFAYCGNRGLKMRDANRDAAEWTWYALGLGALAATSLLWVSTEPEMVWQQRILLGVIGAIFGGAAFIAAGEWARPKTMNAQTDSSPSPAHAEPSSKTNPPINIAGNNNIFSLGQSGGITAGTVNVGLTPRSLSQPRFDGLKKQILSSLPKDKPVTVVAVMGDTEAFSFADEILKYLKENGFDANGVDQAVFIQPIKGLQVQHEKDKRSFIVGANLP